MAGANWYVDASTNTGNGTDPASPFSSVLSITWGDGDRAWVRNTHNEGLTNSQYLGPNSTWNAYPYNRNAFVIGWPQAGWPYYDERPARGVTVGWDADAPSTDQYSCYGYKFPKFGGGPTNSNGVLLEDGVTLANLYLNNSGDNRHYMWSTNLARQGRVLSNVMITANTQPYTAIQDAVSDITMKRVILCGSRVNGGAVLSNDFRADILEIHSKSIVTGGLITANGPGVNIGMLVNYTASLDQIMAMTGTDSPAGIIGPDTYIGRCTGVRPYSGFVSSLQTVGECYAACDDYYGEGPLIATPLWGWRVGSSGECQYNATNATVYKVNSLAAALQDYRSAGHVLPLLRQYVNCASGTKLTIKVPIYVDTTATFSPAGGTMYGTLYAAGVHGQVVSCRSNIAPGSYTNWTGSFIAGGSCWIFSCVFTPTETNSNVLFTFNPGHYIQATSGQGLLAYTLFGKPDVV